MLALEPRLKAAVLVVGGFWQQKGTPEVEQINFAPRVTIPVLMLNGRYDFVFPVEMSQLPMLKMLGTSPEHNVTCCSTVATRCRRERSSRTHYSGLTSTSIPFDSRFAGVVVSAVSWTHVGTM